MMTIESAHELRKHAPMHYFQRAQNARYTAILLHQVATEVCNSIADQAGYSGNTGIACAEAEVREWAIALELMIKAAICVKIQSQTISTLPKTHDLISLWGTAGLKGLSDREKFQLQYLTTIAIWVGKYPTAKTEANENSDLTKLRGLEDRLPAENMLGKIKIRKTISIERTVVDDLFQFASTECLRWYRAHTGR